MVVGIGASAGGLEAFTELLEAAPRDAGLSFVLVQHLSPHHDSVLPDLLASHTTMPVTHVTDGVGIESNHVYVIPPNVRMVIEAGTLRLTPRVDDQEAPGPIDAFFMSLAQVFRDRAIAVVLSGMGSDGAIGIREVKAGGGITFAQTPASAGFDGMPRAAIATGLIDRVLPPNEIGEELSSIAGHAFVRDAHADQGRELTDAQLQRIFDLLRPVSGVDFRHYKQPTIRRRLLRRMALRRITEVTEYITLLETDDAELRGLFQDVLIHVTRFFREPESFKALVADVFPALFEGRDSETPVRVWVCGCATGEEAYSLAIELVDFLHRRDLSHRVQIFATDVSESAIEHARAGIYPASIAADVGAERLRRYFTRTDGNYRINKQIRDLCVFARQDLTKDPPFSRLDLVMCRNVLIYMDTALQRKLIGLFHYALLPAGYLVLGQAESIGTHASLFSLLDKKHRIHRKKALPGVAPTVQTQAYQASSLARKRPASKPESRDAGLHSEVNRVLLDRYAPAGVVVDGDLQIVQFRGETGSFLEPAPGDASLNLLKMVREGLLFDVRAAVQEARKSRQPVKRDNLEITVGRQRRRVAIEVVPLSDSERPHFLVLFEDLTHARSRAKQQPATARKTTSRDAAGVAMLQRELAASREYLQSIIQELEAANEELQSANEEILSSNEELQSTIEELDTAKEELQSTNEELTTVNEELHARNEELSRVNSDLLNLVGSVHIAIVIVSNDLRIRRFTPMAEKVLNLIPADLDRSIAHINPNIECPNLPALIVECIDNVVAIERDVRDRQGRWFALRIRPYKSLDNKIEGAVLALFDIDILKHSEQSLLRAQAFANGVTDHVAVPMAILDSELRVRRTNTAFAALFGRTPAELVGRALHDVGGDAWRLAEWRGYTAAEGELPSLTIGRAPDSARFTLRGHVLPAPDAADASLLMVTLGDHSAS